MRQARRSAPTTPALGLAPRLAPYGLLFGLALAVTWPLWRAAGMPYNVDISGFFPLTVDAYEARFWPLWNERGGMSTLQFVPALLVELPLLLVGSAFGWDMAFHIKLRVLLGFALAGMAMYALARYHLEKRYADRLGPWALALLPLVPAVFFAYNPWSVHRVFHYFLWLGYAFAPLVLLAFERFADRPGWRSALVLAAVAAVATTDPHNPPHYALLVAPFALVRLAAAWRRDEARPLLRFTGVAAGAYVVLGAYWILPYVYSALTNPGFGPTYVLSDEMLGVLSRNGGLWEAIRLIHNYNPRAPLMPAAGAALSAWNVASLVVPALAALALLLARRHAVAWVYGALGVGSLLLGMGANAPMGSGYHWLLFDAPWGEGLSWLFRDPYRWGGFQALAYAALLAFALAEITARVRVAPLRIGAPSASLAATALFVLPALSGYVGAVYAPVEIPGEYAAANAHLALTPEDASVMWMPRVLGATTWSGERTLAYFDATSSARMALGPFRPHTDTYFRFVEDAARDGGDVPSVLGRAGVDRIVFHNDRDPVTDAEKAFLLERSGLVREARVGDTVTRAIDQASTAPASTPAAKYVLNGTRELSQTFTPVFATPVLLTLRAQSTGAPSTLEVRIVDGENETLATKRATVESQPKEVSLGLRGVKLTPGQEHRIVVRATGVDARWELSYYKVDAYRRGTLHASEDGATWKPLAGDLAFELQSEVRGFVTVLRTPEATERLTASTDLLASPAGLPLLRTLAAMPEGSGVAEAPVLFTGASETAREGFAQGQGTRWVAPLDGTPWERLVPFLPGDVFISPFQATTTANGTSGWARGTPEFTYYEWGWSTSLAALKQESWDLDGDRGLVYTSAAAELALPIPEAASGTRATVLVRVYEHPLGGRLTLRTTDGGLIGAIDTHAPVAGFRWVDAGTLPEGAGSSGSLVLEGDGSFLGVNALAVVPPGVLTQARLSAQERFAQLPYVLLAEGETTPALASRVVALPGVGRVGELNASATMTFDAPSRGPATLWLRVANGTALPTAMVDGAPLADATCVAECDGPASWYAVRLGAIDAGRHELTLGLAQPKDRPQIDVLAVASGTETTLMSPARDVELMWERVGATGYRATLDATGPVTLTLHVPYDPGWVARVDGVRVPGLLANGIVTQFTFDADGATDVEITYEPQTWAARGATASALGLLGLAGVLAAPLVARRRAPRAGEPAPEDAE